MNNLSGIYSDTQKTLSGIISTYSDISSTTNSNCDNLTVNTSLTDNGTLNVLGQTTLNNVTITGILSILASLITFTNITVSNLASFLNISAIGLTSLFNLTVTGITNLLVTTCTALTATSLNVSGNSALQATTCTNLTSTGTANLQGTTCTNLSSTGTATLQNTTCNTLTTYGAINAPSLTTSGNITASGSISTSSGDIATTTGNLFGGGLFTNQMFCSNKPLTIFQQYMPYPTTAISQSGTMVGWNAYGIGETDFISLAQLGIGGFNFSTITSTVANNVLASILPYSNGGLVLNASCGNLRINEFQGGAFNTTIYQNGNTSYHIANGISPAIAFPCGNASGVLINPLLVSSSSVATYVPFLPQSTTAFNLFHPTTNLALPTLANQYATVGYVSSVLPVIPASLIGTNNSWTGTNQYNSSLPTTTLTPSASNQFVSKAYVDSLATSTATVLLPLNNVWTGINSYNTNLPTTTLLPTVSNQFSSKLYVDQAISAQILKYFTRFGSFSNFSTTIGATTGCTFPIAQTTNISAWCLYNTNSTPNDYATWLPGYSLAPTTYVHTAPTVAQNQYAFTTIRVYLQVMDSNLVACSTQHFTTQIYWGRWNTPYFPPYDANAVAGGQNWCTFPYTFTLAGNPNSNGYYNLNNTIGTPGATSNAFNYIGQFSRNFRQYWTDPVGSTGISTANTSVWGTLNASDVGTFYLTINQPTASTTGAFYYNISVELIGQGPAGLPATTLINSATNISY
jgi:hypothetical protein